MSRVCAGLQPSQHHPRAEVQSFVSYREINGVFLVSWGVGAVEQGDGGGMMMIKRYGGVMCNAGRQSGVACNAGRQSGVVCNVGRAGALICRTVFPVVLVIEHGDVRVVA